MSETPRPFQPFKLERYFAEYEFKVQYLLSPSDCEALTLPELLEDARPETRRLWEDLSLGYTESQGHPLLRDEIAALYLSISPDEVLVAVPEEAIFIAMHTLLRPGDHVIALHPAYQSLYEIARGIGCEVSFWPLRPGEKGWTLDLDEVEGLVRPNTRLLVINFPHNPTGFLPTLPELEAIIALARRHNLHLFSDEMYRLLEYRPEQRLPAVCDLYEKGISLSGMSKSFALPGLRLGWLCTASFRTITSWLALKDYTTICSSAPSEILALLALQAQPRILKRNREIITTNLRLAEAFMQRHAAHFDWLAPLAGSIAFPRWLGPGSVEEFCQALLDKMGVMVVPGSIFDYPGSHFRVGLGRRSFPEALERVSAFLAAP